MATFIIALIVVAAVYLAARITLRAHRSGGCSSCPSCGKCGGCCTESRPSRKAKPPACCGSREE